MTPSLARRSSSAVTEDETSVHATVTELAPAVAETPEGAEGQTIDDVGVVDASCWSASPGSASSSLEELDGEGDADSSAGVLSKSDGSTLEGDGEAEADGELEAEGSVAVGSGSAVSDSLVAAAGVGDSEGRSPTRAVRSTSDSSTALSSVTLVDSVGVGVEV